ncbi:MAG TPA: hypothetical protein GX004_04370 [Firmicutes bacterium]|jgi:tetratricopeptide (TPR) repeat protein|nr:hypothetical protein [Bacillota bacterium]
MSVKKTGKQKISKLTRKKIIYFSIALLLVGGLVLSSTYGIFNFFFGGGKLVSQAEGDEYLYSLLQHASDLEKALNKDPADFEGKVDLADTYYGLSMYYYMQQKQKEAESYAEKSRKLLFETLEEGVTEPGVTLKIALLALLEGDDTQAETYFKKTLELEETNPDAHLYLGSLLYSRGMEDEAINHWEEALEQAEEGSPVAQTARYYLDLSKAEESGQPEADESSQSKVEESGGQSGADESGQ